MRVYSLTLFTKALAEVEINDDTRVARSFKSVLSYIWQCLHKSNELHFSQACTVNRVEFGGGKSSLHGVVFCTRPVTVCNCFFFCQVVLVRRKNTGVLYAMKILKKGDVVRKRQVERTKIERRVLGNVEHPFLMRLHYAFQVKKQEENLIRFIFFWPDIEASALFKILCKTHCFLSSR